MTTTEIPGTMITGRAGVPASRLRTLERKLDRTIDQAVAYVADLQAREYAAARAAGIVAAPAAKLTRIEREQARFASIKVGDRIDVGGNGTLVVSKVNAKSVKAGSCSWKASEILQVIAA